ncbi:class II aldolase/adducin family protein [Alphaproteobacteria bacterium]|nr:class II aldolase/adducin family protein [Alphaproteobacteria bacterium]
MYTLSSDLNKSLKQNLILSHHILYNEGQSSDVAGHISSKLSNSEVFYTNGFPLGFDEAEIAQIKEVNFNNYNFKNMEDISPAIDLHCEIYKKYPNINAIVHTHPYYATSLGVIEKNLEMVDQQASPFFNKIKLFNENFGVFDNGQGGVKEIIEIIKNNKALILQNHGILVFGESIQEATIGAIILEKAAKIQIISMSSGNIKTIPKDSAVQANNFLSQKNIIDYKFDYFARRAIRKNAKILDMIKIS